LKKKLDELQMRRMELKSRRKPLTAHIKKLTRTFAHLLPCMMKHTASEGVGFSAALGG